MDKENLTCSPFAFHLTVTCFSLARHLLLGAVLNRTAPFLDAFAQVAGTVGNVSLTCLLLARHLLRRDVFGQMAPFLDAFAQVAGSWTMGISLACHLLFTCLPFASWGRFQSDNSQS